MWQALRLSKAPRSLENWSSLLWRIKKIQIYVSIFSCAKKLFLACGFGGGFQWFKLGSIAWGQVPYLIYTLQPPERIFFLGELSLRADKYLRHVAYQRHHPLHVTWCINRFLFLSFFFSFFSATLDGIQGLLLVLHSGNNMRFQGLNPDQQHTRQMPLPVILSLWILNPFSSWVKTLSESRFLRIYSHIKFPHIFYLYISSS